MPTAEKAKSIEQAKEWYSKSLGVVFADYRGLSVKDVQALRRQLRDKGAELHVIKNTLFRIAAGEDVDKLPEDLHNGPTAVAFVFQNESDIAKSLFDYAKTHKTLKVKGGFFGGRAFSSKDVETLAMLPPRDILLAQLIGTIASPLSTLVGTIEALYADPIRVIGAVADKVAESSPAPKAEAPAPPVAEATASPEAEVAPATASEETPVTEAAESAEPAEVPTEAVAEAPAETPEDTTSPEAAEATDPPTE